MLIMWRIGVFVLVALFAGVAFSKEYPKAETAKTEKAPEDEQRGSDKNPFTVKVLPAPDAESKAAKEEGYRQEKASDDKWIMGATVWLAVVTTILAGVTAGLWIATYNLARDAKRTADRQRREMKISLAIAKRSANAAKNSAEAAERTVKIMKDTAEKQLRAYVAVLNTEIVNNASPAIPGRHVSIWMKNFGQTPATAIDYWIITAPEKFPLEINLVKPPGTTVHRAGVIAPDHVFEVCAKIPLLTNGQEREITATHALYVYGEFHYTDAFSRRQVSPFRYMRRGGINWAHEGELEMCEDGNDPTQPPLYPFH